MNLCCKADPQGRSQGCDLQRNSLQQERNQKLVNTVINPHFSPGSREQAQDSCS
jgi:hypothetical protein